MPNNESGTVCEIFALIFSLLFMWSMTLPCTLYSTAMSLHPLWRTPVPSILTLIPRILTPIPSILTLIHRILTLIPSILNYSFCSLPLICRKDLRMIIQPPWLLLRPKLILANYDLLQPTAIIYCSQGNQMTPWREGAQADHSSARREIQWTDEEKEDGVIHSTHQSSFNTCKESIGTLTTLPCQTQMEFYHLGKNLISVTWILMIFSYGPIKYMGRE